MMSLFDRQGLKWLFYICCVVFALSLITPFVMDGWRQTVVIKPHDLSRWNNSLKLQQAVNKMAMQGVVASYLGAFLFGASLGRGSRLFRTPLFVFGLALLASPLFLSVFLAVLGAVGFGASGGAQGVGSTLAFYVSILLVLGGVPPIAVGFLLFRKKPKTDA